MNWYKIKNYEGVYEVSDDGTIRSVDRKAGHQNLRGRVIKPSADKRGYLRVRLSKENIQKTHTVHKLLYESAVSEVNSGMHIDHIDGDPGNNNLSNLRVVTPGQNHRSYNRPRSGSSKYRGVSLRKDCGLFRAEICFNYQNEHLGYFKTEEEAAVAWNERAVELGFDERALNPV